MSSGRVVAQHGTRRLQTTLLLSDEHRHVLVRRWAPGQPALRPAVAHPDPAAAAGSLLEPASGKDERTLVYVDAGPLSLAELLPRLLGAPGMAAAWTQRAAEALSRLHRPLSAGRHSGARLERLSTLWTGEGAAARAARAQNLPARWREQLGEPAWAALRETVVDQATTGDWWTVGDAALAGLRCTGEHELRVLCDGHAGRGAREVDAGFVLGELVELHETFRRKAHGQGSAELGRAVLAFEAALAPDVDRALLRRVAAGRILLHALDYLEYVGWEEELRDYGHLARAAL